MQSKKQLSHMDKDIRFFETSVTKISDYINVLRTMKTPTLSSDIVLVFASMFWKL